MLHEGIGFTEEDTAFLAQIIVRNYIRYFGPPSRPCEMKRLQEMHFASNQAKYARVSDIDLFYLVHAVRTANPRYLYHLIATYDVRGDPQQADPGGD